MKLSVNLNKIALLRNSRGGNTPSLIDYAEQSIKLGVDGLTLHPRPDHRHATSKDALLISDLCKKNNIEFNLEGNPFSISDGEYLGFELLCQKARPDQITLVPDSLDQITSDHGWQPGHMDQELRQFIDLAKQYNTRTSLFIDANFESVKYASDLGVSRIEIYTGPFAECLTDENLAKFQEVKSQITDCIAHAQKLNLGVNAGHDLNLINLPHLHECGEVDEVSIGHAIMTDALKFGFHDTIIKYLKSVRKTNVN
jgi:pyridoxine 5-phosphate synthase